MAWSWRILRAAVEQEILFPSRSCFVSYIDGLKKKNEPFEVLAVTDNEDGTATVVMRKRYNPQNAFFGTERKGVMAQRIVISFEKGLCKLVGVDFGRETYQRQVKGIVDLSQDVIFVVPAEIDGVSSTFIEGFFEEIVNEIGIDGVRKHVAFESSLEGFKMFVLLSLEWPPHR